MRNSDDRDDHDARMASNARDNAADGLAAAERDSRRKVPHQTAPKWRSDGVQPAPDRAAEVRALAEKAGLLPHHDVRCPRCGDSSIGIGHHNPSWTAPECDYFVCEACDHQWGHS